MSINVIILIFCVWLSPIVIQAILFFIRYDNMNKAIMNKYGKSKFVFQVYPHINLRGLFVPTPYIFFYDEFLILKYLWTGREYKVLKNDISIFDCNLLSGNTRREFKLNVGSRNITLYTGDQEFYEILNKFIEN